MGTNSNKNCFSPKNEQHTAKISFFVIFKHFRGNSQRTSLFNQKSGYLRKENGNTQKVWFSKHVWKGWILCKIRICLNNCFWSNRSMGTYSNKNCFSPQSEPHTAKLCFSVLFKHFWRNSQRTSFFVKKVTITERSTEIHRKFVFLIMFVNGKSWLKFGFV